jgi:hypothetical protein
MNALFMLQQAHIDRLRALGTKAQWLAETPVECYCCYDKRPQLGCRACAVCNRFWCIKCQSAARDVRMCKTCNAVYCSIFGCQNDDCDECLVM